MSAPTSQRPPLLILKNGQGTWDFVLQKGQQIPPAWPRTFQSLRDMVDGDAIKDKFFELRWVYPESRRQAPLSSDRGINEYRFPLPQYFMMNAVGVFGILLKNNEQVPAEWPSMYHTRRDAQLHGLREVWTSGNEPAWVAGVVAAEAAELQEYILPDLDGEDDIWEDGSGVCFQ